MKIRKSKKAVGPKKFTPPVGFQIAPSAPAGGGTNVAAMRPNFAFLPYNQDAIEQRITEAKLKWRSENRTANEDEFPGIPNLFGGDTPMGAGVVGAAESNAQSAMAVGRCLAKVFSGDWNKTGGVDPKVYCSQHWKEY